MDKIVYAVIQTVQFEGDRTRYIAFNRNAAVDCAVSIINFYSYNYDAIISIPSEDNSEDIEKALFNFKNILVSFIDEESGYPCSYKIHIEPVKVFE